MAETYRIGKLAELAGVTRRTVHYYINKGLIPPAKGAGINSFYTADHLNRIRLIRKLQESYLPLDEIRQIVAPLGPSGVVEYLERYAHRPPLPVKRPVAHERTPEDNDQVVLKGQSLYERVDLGGNVELHIPAELTEKRPALVHSLVEKAKQILRSK